MAERSADPSVGAATAAASFEHERPRLAAMAYRMLGSHTEAEDAVQETYLRWAAADQAVIDNVGAWLTTVCTRICLDRLRSATRRRETYVGPWLPEPVLTDDLDLTEATAMGESLTLAFLVVLESLSPLERVAFLLHDVFEHGYDDIAAVLDRTPDAVRQLVSRARRHLEERRPRFELDAQRRWEVADAFVAAAAGGDMEGMLALLAPDVVLTADGGGVVSAARRPLEGPDRVTRFLLGLFRQATETVEIVRHAVNGMPALVVRDHGDLVVVFGFDVADGVVTAIHAVRNPAKFGGLRGATGPRTGSGGS
ncbi:MAG: RNA polymerase sigma factor SigJ [Actinobacteria bacterium]|nr:RNA polymerase sigma factor SigJ [Actinomycetota bacterium]